MKLKWWQWGLVGFGVLVVIGALAGDPEGEDADGEDPSASAAQEEPKEEKPANASASEEAPNEEMPESVEDRLRAALEDVDGPVQDPEVTEISYSAKQADVTVKTPEGGLDGPSTQDLDWQAGAVFDAMYDGTDFTGEAVVILQGGLVDTATGKDLPEENTGIYMVKAKESKQIDWSDDDAIEHVIDWSIYRDFVHPALKQD